MSAKIIRPLPGLPNYSQQKTPTYFNPQKSFDYFPVSAENIDEVLADLNTSLKANGNAITKLLKNLVAQPNIELHILLSNQIYYLMIKNTKTYKVLAVHALTCFDGKSISSSISISSSFSSFTNRSFKISIQIIDENEEKQFICFDDQKKIKISFEKFISYINLFIKDGDLPVSVQSNNRETQTSQSNTNTKKYDSITKYKDANRSFIRELNSRLSPLLLSDAEINSLAQSPIDVHFQTVYDFISEEMKKTLINNGVDKKQIEIEKNRMFLSLIMDHTISYINTRYCIHKRYKNKDKDKDKAYIAYTEIQNLLNQYSSIYNTIIDEYRSGDLQRRDYHRPPKEKVAELVAIRNARSTER